MDKRQKVITPSLLAVDETFEDERFMKVRIDVLESDVEAQGHGFYFSRKALENGQDTFANIPILAHVVIKEDEDGNKTLDFGSHDFHIEPDLLNDGESKIIYDELIVGIVPESCNLTITDNEAGHAVLSVDAFLCKEYGGYVCDILEEKDGHTAVSAEVDIETVKDPQRKLERADSLIAWGITLLGEDVGPAIASAHTEFLSADEETKHKQLQSIMQELKESLDKYTKAVEEAEKNKGKEESQVGHFEELLTKYQLSAEDVTFDHANMSDEELDKAFEELAKNKENTPASAPEPQPKQKNVNTVELSVKIGENTINLSKSLTDVIYALTDLVNKTYMDDGTYYACDVFDSGSAKSRYVIMMDVYGGKAYKQAWTVKDGEYSLKNDRVEVFSEWLTDEERNQLDDMRSRLAALSTEVDEYKAKLAKLEAEPEKMELLQSEYYADISETTEYTELLENHSEITKEDLAAKLDAILLAQAKERSKANLAAKKEQKPEENGVKLFPTGNMGETAKSRYGGAFVRND